MPSKIMGHHHQQNRGLQRNHRKNNSQHSRNHGKLKKIDSSTVRNRIRVAVKAIGKEKLGFTEKEVGTHSIRTSFATLLHLRKVDPILIQIGGRWKSKAFLKFIQRDTTEFAITRGISHRRNRDIKKLK